MLIDVHAHFLHDRTPRADWRERNTSRLRAGERVGIGIHVASILGSWGATSPTYFPSLADLRYGNDWLLLIQSIEAIPDPAERLEEQHRLARVLLDRIKGVDGHGPDALEPVPPAPRKPERRTAPARKPAPAQ